MAPFEVPTVTVDQVPDDALFLDVREEHEWQAGHITGAVHLPMNSVPAAVSGDQSPLLLDVPIVVVCAVGGRSGQVTAWLVEHGFQASNLAGGMHAWADAGRALITETGAAPRVL